MQLLRDRSLESSLRATLGSNAIAMEWLSHVSSDVHETSRTFSTAPCRTPQRHCTGWPSIALWDPLLVVRHREARQSIA